MPEQILVPVDGSERSTEALTYAIETFPDATITALHVLEYGMGDLGTFSGMTGDLPDDEAAEAQASEVLEEAERLGEKHGVDVEGERGQGRPERVIVKYVEEDGYDLVVIGSHGRDGVARVLLGSVAEKVVRRSPVPTLVVR